MARTSKPRLPELVEEDVYPVEVLEVEGQLVTAPVVGGPLELVAGIDAWERQPAETDKEWAYFQYYRDLPPFDRNIKATYLHFFPEPAIADCTGRPVYNWMQDIAQSMRWRDRVAEYDRFQDEHFRSALLAARTEARRETALLGRDMRRKAHRALRRVQEVLVVEETDPNTGEVKRVEKTILTVREILDMAKVGSDLETTALDMDKGDIVAGNVNIFVKDEDDQLLSAAAELIRAKEAIDITPTKRGGG